MSEPIYDETILRLEKHELVLLYTSLAKDVVDLEKENTHLRGLLRRVVGYLEDNLDSHAHDIYDEFVDELAEELS